MNGIREFFNFFVYFPLHFKSFSTKIYGHAKIHECVINSTTIRTYKHRNKYLATKNMMSISPEDVDNFPTNFYLLNYPHSFWLLEQ